MVAVVVMVTTLSVGFAEQPRVQEIPIHKDATDVTTMRRRGDIRFKINSDFKTTGNYYATVLKGQKWTKAPKENLQKNFWVQTFTRNDSKLEVRVDQRGTDCEVRLTPTGFTWDEDLTPRPKDLPIPEDAKDPKFDDFFERIEFQSATALEKLAEFYVSKLDPKIWSKSGDDLINARAVQLKRTSGKASVVISIRPEGEANQVKISTQGMVWDDIKAANALAKKAMDRSTDRPSSSSDRPKTVTLPARVDKPKKGIASLEKLVSKCVITLDGKQIELPQIMAYEAVNNGRWRTKVIATVTAVNQQSLLQQLKDTASDEGWDLASPYLKLDLDDQDRAMGISLGVAGIPGGAYGDELEGDALVEDGRVRGTAKVKPKKFFDKSYSAEITYDVPLFTRESTPVKRLVNAAKLANAGKLTIAGKTHSVSHVTLYETKQFDSTLTAVLITERPINLQKLQASLAKPDKNDADLFEFQTQVKLLFNAREQLHGISIWCDNLSISSVGADNIQSSIIIEDGRVRGTAKTTESGETFGKKYDFDVSFDGSLLNPTGGK